MSAASGAPVREGFKELLASVALGEVGVVLSLEPSRLSRSDQDWCHLMELAGTEHLQASGVDHDVSRLSGRRRMAS